MTEAIGREAAGLYKQSSKLRTMARMLEGNGDTDRPAVTFDANELSGFSSLLLAVAEEIDATRDRMEDATAA
jgi:hypothetical protein